MEIEGIVYSLLAPAQGVSNRGSAWKKQDVVIETQEGEYSRKVCITFFGDKANETSSLVKGEKVKVSINLESREFNGKWFTNVNGWKLDRLSIDNSITNEMPPISAGNYDEFSALSSSSEEDLPF